MSCWYCTFPNDIPILFNHPGFVILDMKDKILCVRRGHGDIEGCKPCLIDKMKKQFKLYAMMHDFNGKLQESWESDHLHYIIEK
jgi:hypothetical protein